MLFKVSSLLTYFTLHYFYHLKCVSLFLPLYNSTMIPLQLNLSICLWLSLSASLTGFIQIGADLYRCDNHRTVSYTQGFDVWFDNNFYRSCHCVYMLSYVCVGVWPSLAQCFVLVSQVSFQMQGECGISRKLAIPLSPKNDYTVYQCS